MNAMTAPHAIGVTGTAAHAAFGAGSAPAAHAHRAAAAAAAERKRRAASDPSVDRGLDI